MELRDELIRGAERLGAELTEEAVDAFFLYLTELKRWNKKVNLTSVTKDREIVVRHFLDSLTICHFIWSGARVLDLGSGGGFPGIPLKLAMPETWLALLESTGKKSAFLRHIVRILGLEGVEVINERAEADFLQKERSRSFDFVVSRAFSTLKEFVTLSAPYLAPEGEILAMKGPSATEELALITDLEAFSLEHGLVFEGSNTIQVPFSERSTTIVRFTRPAL